MGCKMSKATDQVIEPVSAVDAPASTAPVSASAQAAPVSSTEPVAEVVSEQPTAVEQPAAEAVQEEAPAAPVAEEETSAAEDAAPVEPAAEAAVAEPVAEVEAAVEPEAVAPEPEVTPVEAAVEEEAADNNKEERTTEEVETEVEAHADNQGESVLQFAAAGVTVDDKGVAFYQFEGTNASDPALTVVLSKRYSEFKALYPELAKLMASESNVPASQTDKFETYPALPALPKGNAATYFRRSSGKLLHEREAQFVAILNAAARHPIAASSDKFQAFLA